MQAVGNRLFYQIADKPGVSPNMGPVRMSYRSVKRVLGETRLELKCLLLFAVCLLTLIGGSFWWYGSQAESLVYDNSRNACRHLVDSEIFQEHVKAMVLTEGNRPPDITRFESPLRTGATGTEVTLAQMLKDRKSVV